jgi:trigger factor
LTESDNDQKRLNVDVHKGKAWKRILEIEVSKETVEEGFEAAYQKYRGEAKIPGFRKGKAPMDMVKRRFKDAIKKEVLEALVPQAYEDAISQTDLSPISLPRVKDIEFKEGAALKFKAEIEVKPEVEVKDYTGMEVTKQVVEITDREVDTSLNYLRDDFAELHPVQREAKLYDHMVVDLIKNQDGKEEKLQNHEIILDPHNMIKEFQQALVGAKAGEKREFEVTYPPDFHNKKLAGKKAQYRISIKEIKEKVLPKANDDFAKTVGKFQTLAELKEKIKEGLGKKAQRDAEIQLKNELVNQVIKRNPFEVPEALIDYYMESLISDLKNKYKKVDEAKVRKDYQETAIGHIKWDLLFHQITDKEKIKVADEDIQAWIEAFARDYKMKPDEAKKLLEKPQQFKRIKEELLEKKVLDFLRRSAKVSEETIPSQVIPEDSNQQEK